MKRSDRRLQTLGLVVIVVASLVMVLEFLPSRGVQIEGDPQPTVSPTVSSTVSPAPPAPENLPAHQHELARRFEAAAVMLHAKQYEHALVALRQVLLLAPRMPEAHTNRGFALLGLKRPELAEQAFRQALEIKREQLNAYYGLAIAREDLGDRPGALGAMRTFVHLANAEDPFVRKGRAALWEWQDASQPPGEPEHALALSAEKPASEPETPN
ncbi:MAG: tetratricopeptide repeat protein [Deltaproteobacteria bacterium]|nr:tetratricopeptide repeat protein [Deltaproteobacteria bacterium]